MQKTAVPPDADCVVSTHFSFSYLLFSFLPLHRQVLSGLEPTAIGLLYLAFDIKLNLLLEKSIPNINF